MYRNLFFAAMLLLSASLNAMEHDKKEQAGKRTMQSRIEKDLIGAIGRYIQTGMMGRTNSESDILNEVKQLIQSRASVNTQDIAGMSALQHASLCGKASVVKFLIDSNADLEYRSPLTGMSALNYASNATVLKVLQDNGASEEGPKITCGVFYAPQSKKRDAHAS